MTSAGATTITLARSFARDERGATAVEYGLIAAGIAGAIMAAVTGLGAKVADMWTSVGDQVSGL
jgi:pilus assembly protein Flp/PilA